MSKRGENIYKRKDGRWEGRYVKCRTLHGKIQYGYVYGKSYSETKAKLKENASAPIRSSSSQATQSALYDEVLKAWLLSSKNRVKESTFSRYAYRQLTGKSAYEQTDQREYKRLVAELKRDITYKDGIQFPREGAELKQFLPRLCAKYPDRWLEPHWNLDLKVVRELFYAGKVHGHRQQVCKKKNRGHGGEAR